MNDKPVKSVHKENNYVRIPIPPKNITNPLLAILLAIAAFYSGYATKIIQDYKTGNISGGSQNTNQQANISGAPQAVPTENTQPRDVKMGDSPMIGDKNAPVTMIEFSDYECPFCKRYFTDTYSQIKKDYVDTGKVKIVFRDLPLSFHQNAKKEAEAARCIREQGGDDAYWKYHDEMFTKTTSNGTGLALTELPTLAANIGYDGAALQKCLDEGKFTKVVEADLAYSGTVGATATPSFFIGKSDASGTIKGVPVIGAQDFSTFKAEIDKLL